MTSTLSRYFWMLLFITPWIPNINSKDLRIVCYYTNWSVYRPGPAKFNPQNINPYLCTHLIYAFGGFTKENTLKPFDKYQDIEKGGYAKFTGLKTYNKNLKTMIAIGGWNEGSSRFSPMVANADRRKELVRNVIKFLRQNHFDGLDLDWEYPSFRDGGKSRDRDNYADLVQELREEFDRESQKTGRPRLLLTMAVPAGIEYINKGYDVPRLTKYLDWMNILSYDYHSAFEPAVNHHSPLYPLEEEDPEYSFDADLNIDYTIQHYMKMGASANKLVLGIPTYGRSYTLYNPEASEIGDPADGPGDMGEATRENGYLAYYEICENVKDNDWTVVQPNPDAMGPYAHKDNQWVGYDDEDIVRKKSEYVAKKGLGGIMFWSIDNDDFRGNCHGRPYPLIEAAKEALIAALGITEDNFIAPPTKQTKTKSRNRVSAKTDRGETKAKNNALLTRRRSTTTRKPEENEESATRKQQRVRPNKARNNRRRNQERSTTSTESSLAVTRTTPSYKTPDPPTTPDPGGDFKCEDEGFFPHPRDCKKYFWCLSGPAESGIIGHQFTCPAGLYFNKAADSCDYTQNVLCNKKLSKKTTTTTEAITTSKPSTTRKASTARATTTTTTTTTEAYDYDEEYEYEDDVDDDDDDDETEENSEEDPKYIKELLDLIKKAGGVEQLEKYLKMHESAGSSSSGATTVPSISQSLYQRVLANAKRQKVTNSRTTNARYTSSKVAQNSVSERELKTAARGKLQYSSISRNRSATASTPEEDNEEEVEKEDEATSSKSRSRNIPEYVTIRRGRISTTEAYDETDESSKRRQSNKILLEENAASSTISTPGYVTIKRSRPTTASTLEDDDDSDVEDEEEEDSRRSKLLGEDESEEYASRKTFRPGFVVEKDETDFRKNLSVIDDQSQSGLQYTSIQRAEPTEESIVEEGVKGTDHFFSSQGVVSKQSTEEINVNEDKTKYYSTIQRSRPSSTVANIEQEDEEFSTDDKIKIEQNQSDSAGLAIVAGARDENSKSEVNEKKSVNIRRGEKVDRKEGDESTLDKESVRHVIAQGVENRFNKTRTDARTKSQSTVTVNTRVTNRGNFRPSSGLSSDNETTISETVSVQSTRPTNRGRFRIASKSTSAQETATGSKTVRGNRRKLTESSVFNEESGDLSRRNRTYVVEELGGKTTPSEVVIRSKSTSFVNADVRDFTLTRSGNHVTESTNVNVTNTSDEKESSSIDELESEGKKKQSSEEDSIIDYDYDESTYKGKYYVNQKGELRLTGEVAKKGEDRYEETAVQNSENQAKTTKLAKGELAEQDKAIAKDKVIEFIIKDHSNNRDEHNIRNEYTGSLKKVHKVISSLKPSEKKLGGIVNSRHHIYIGTDDNENTSEDYEDETEITKKYKQIISSLKTATNKNHTKLESKEFNINESIIHGLYSNNEKFASTNVTVDSSNKTSGIIYEKNVTDNYSYNRNKTVEIGNDKEATSERGIEMGSNRNASKINQRVETTNSKQESITDRKLDVFTGIIQDIFDVVKATNINKNTTISEGFNINSTARNISKHVLNHEEEKLSMNGSRFLHIDSKTSGRNVNGKEKSSISELDSKGQAVSIDTTQYFASAKVSNESNIFDTTNNESIISENPEKSLNTVNATQDISESTVATESTSDEETSNINKPRGTRISFDETNNTKETSTSELNSAKRAFRINKSQVKASKKEKNLDINASSKVSLNMTSKAEKIVGVNSKDAIVSQINNTKEVSTTIVDSNEFSAINEKNKSSISKESNTANFNKKEADSLATIEESILDEEEMSNIDKPERNNKKETSETSELNSTEKAFRTKQYQVRPSKKESNQDTNTFETLNRTSKAEKVVDYTKVNEFSTQASATTYEKNKLNVSKESANLNKEEANSKTKNARTSQINTQAAAVISKEISTESFQNEKNILTEEEMTSNIDKARISFAETNDKKTTSASVLNSTNRAFRINNSTKKENNLDNSTFQTQEITSTTVDSKKFSTQASPVAHEKNNANLHKEETNVNSKTKNARISSMNIQAASKEISTESVLATVDASQNRKNTQLKTDESTVASNATAEKETSIISPIIIPLADSITKNESSTSQELLYTKASKNADFQETKILKKLNMTQKTENVANVSQIDTTKTSSTVDATALNKHHDVQNTLSSFKAFNNTHYGNISQKNSQVIVESNDDVLSKGISKVLNSDKATFESSDSKSADISLTTTASAGSFETTIDAQKSEKNLSRKIEEGTNVSNISISENTTSNENIVSFMNSQVNSTKAEENLNQTKYTGSLQSIKTENQKFSDINKTEKTQRVSTIKEMKNEESTTSVITNVKNEKESFGTKQEINAYQRKNATVQRSSHQVNITDKARAETAKNTQSINVRKGSIIKTEQVLGENTSRQLARSKQRNTSFEKRKSKLRRITEPKELLEEVYELNLRKGFRNNGRKQALNSTRSSFTSEDLHTTETSGRKHDFERKFHRNESSSGEIKTTKTLASRLDFNLQEATENVLPQNTTTQQHQDILHDINTRNNSENSTIRTNNQQETNEKISLHIEKRRTNMNVSAVSNETNSNVTLTSELNDYESREKNADSTLTGNKITKSISNKDASTDLTAIKTGVKNRTTLTPEAYEVYENTSTENNENVTFGFGDQKSNSRTEFDFTSEEETAKTEQLDKDLKNEADSTSFKDSNIELKNTQQLQEVDGSSTNAEYNSNFSSTEVKHDSDLTQNSEATYDNSIQNATNDDVLNELHESKKKTNTGISKFLQMMTTSNNIKLNRNESTANFSSIEEDTKEDNSGLRHLNKTTRGKASGIFSGEEVLIKQTNKEAFAVQKKKEIENNTQAQEEDSAVAEKAKLSQSTNRTDVEEFERNEESPTRSKTTETRLETSNENNHQRTASETRKRVVSRGRPRVYKQENTSDEDERQTQRSRVDYRDSSDAKEVRGRRVIVKTKRRQQHLNETSTSSYVNIRRSRPTTVAANTNEGDTKSNDEVTTQGYANFRRNRPLGSTTESVDEIARRNRPSNEEDAENKTKVSIEIEQEESPLKQNESTSTSGSIIPMTVLSESSQNQEATATRSTNFLEANSITEINQTKVETTSSVSENTSEHSNISSNIVKTPQLLEPRPFSFSGGRKRIKPTTAAPEAAVKVSATPSRKFLRSRTVNTTAEPAVVRRDDSDEEDNKTADRTRTRGRGASRFTQAPRTRFAEESGKFEKESAYEAEVTIRKYRPAELADLSSLTAVDFAAVKFNGGAGRNTRRRPRPVINAATTTTTTTTTEASSEKTRTLPLARKNGAAFGANNRKRINVETNSNRAAIQTTYKVKKVNTDETRKYDEDYEDATEVDEVQSTSTTKSPLFKRPLNRALIRPKPKEESKVAIKRTSAFAQRPSTKRPLLLLSEEEDNEEDDGDLEEKESGNNIASPKGSFSIRREITADSKIVSENHSETKASNVVTNEPKSRRKIIRRIRVTTPRSVAEKSTASIRDETTVENTTEKEAEVLSLRVTDDDDFENETSDEESEENIKLSESNIRENNAVGRIKNDNIIADDLKPFKSNLFLPPTINSTENERPPIRTRKIIRKFRPTIKPEQEVEPEPKEVVRTRKIIRKFRVSTPATPVDIHDSVTTSIDSEKSSIDADEELVIKNLEAASEIVDVATTIATNAETSTKKSFKLRPKLSLSKLRTTERPAENEGVLKKINRFAPENRRLKAKIIQSDESERLESDLANIGAKLASKNKSRFSQSNDEPEAPKKVLFEPRTKFSFKNRSTEPTTTVDVNLDNDDANNSTESNVEAVITTEEEEEEKPTEEITTLQDFTTLSDILTTTEYVTAENASFYTPQEDEMSTNDYTTTTTEIIEETTVDITTTTTRKPVTIKNRHLRPVGARPKLNLKSRFVSEKASSDEDAVGIRKGFKAITRPKFGRPRVGIKATSENSASEIVVTSTKTPDIVLTTLAKEYSENVTDESTIVETTTSDYNISEENATMPVLEEISNVESTTVTLAYAENATTTIFDELNTTAEFTTILSTATFAYDEVQNTEKIEGKTDANISQVSTAAQEEAGSDNNYNSSQAIIQKVVSNTTLNETISNENDTIVVVTEEIEKLSLDNTENSTSSLEDVKANATTISKDNDNEDEEDNDESTKIPSVVISESKNRIFKPANARPKLKFKPRTQSVTSGSVLHTSTEGKIKTYTRQYKSRTQGKISKSTTESVRYENEELGYGPVKAIKPIFGRGQTAESIYNRRKNLFENHNSDDDDNDEEKEFDDAEEEVDDDEDEENLNDTFEAEEEGDDGDVEEDEHEEDEKEAARPSRLPNVPYAPSSSRRPKPSTRPYRVSTTTSPSVTANLTNIDIEAVNLRNKNLFTKTRKMNTPFSGVPGSTDHPAIDTNNNNTEESQNASIIITHEINKIAETYSSQEDSTEENISEEKTNSSSGAVLLSKQRIVNTPHVASEAVIIKSFDATQSNKQRVVNTPYIVSTTSKEENKTVTETVSEEIKVDARENEDEATTDASKTSTEKLTTLHHIFSDSEPPSTESTTKTDVVNNMNKVERLIEVNRIKEVHAEEGGDALQKDGRNTPDVLPTVDRLGAVNRVTIIKVVEGRNETIVLDETSNVSLKDLKSLEESSSRDGRKFEIYGESKVINFSPQPEKDLFSFEPNSFSVQQNQIHIDSKSSVKTITPRPFFYTEASTIALEALFQTEPAKTNAVNHEELLNTQNSDFVNVRVLKQDQKSHKSLQQDDTNGNLIPVRVLPEDYVTMRAHVVEIGPQSQSEMIRIAPISVSLEKSSLVLPQH